MTSHDDLVARAIDAVKSVDRGAVIRAFVGSLSTRNLPARSAFGSFVVLQAFEAHPFRSSEIFSGSNSCAICGLREANRPTTEEHVSRYPFQVQHTNVAYAALDLETFSRRAVDEPTGESIDRLGRLLDDLRALPHDSELTQLQKSIAKSIKPNKFERMILLETFGYAGILCPPSKRHYGESFVPSGVANSDQPSQYYKREWAYPVRFWTGRDGVNEVLVRSYFEALL